MKRPLFALTFGLCSMAALVSAQVAPAPAPNATLLMGNDMFESGQSNNIGPAVNQVIDNHWTSGACVETNDWEDCDNLRFGMTMYADGDCNDAINVIVAPQEDGGAIVDDRANGIHNEGGDSWCDEYDFRPHDTGLEAHHDYTFENQIDPSDDELDTYWERPHLTIQFIGELPQTDDSSPANRTIDAIRAACDNYDGMGGVLPSMPTWTFLTKRFDAEAAPFAGLVAAGGGTGACCYGPPCDPIDDEIDVCDHVNDGRTDADVRDDIIDGEYVCGPDGTTAGLGHLDFGGEDMGQLKDIRCHFVGDDNNDNCDDGTLTDIFGLFACIRQLPRGVTADEVDIQVCYTGGGVPAAVDSFSAGADHSCLLLLDGTAQCWGEGDGGRLGTGTEDDQTSPTDVAGLLVFAGVSAAPGHSCGVTTDGDVYCWGTESQCSFGDDSNDDQYLEPTKEVVNIGTRVIRVGAGLNHGCAIIEDGTVNCWGDDSNGQLGNGNPKNDSCAPDEVKNLESVIDLSVGYEYSCAVVQGGGGYCWGYNNKGQLGDGTTNTRTGPVEIDDDHSWKKIAAGFEHTCGIDTVGAPWCWGEGGSGQIGDGGNSSYDAPVRVDGISDIRDITVGETHSCAVTNDGEVYCWGDNANGQVTGDSSEGSADSPVLVDELEGIVAIDAGRDHTCALVKDGDLVCWGLGYDIDDVFAGNIDTSGVGGSSSSDDETLRDPHRG